MDEYVSRLKRSLARFSLIAVAVAQVISLAPAPKVYASHGGSSTVVINEFATRGTAGAGDEFVELYNAGAAVALNGWRLERITSTGTLGDVVNFGASDIVLANDYLLIGGDDYSGGNVDKSASLGLANTNNALVLYDASNNVVDKVGYGPSAPDAEATAAEAINVGAGLTSSQSATRNASHADTNHNNVDFTVTSSPSPTRSRPATPTLNLVAGDQKITATWTAIAGVSGYEVNITESGTVFANPDQSESGTGFEFTGLTNGTAYDVRVRAIRDGIASLYATGTKTAQDPTSVPAGAINASLVYKKDGVAGTHFGANNVVRVEVTFDPATVTVADNPAVVLTRSTMAAESFALTYDAVNAVWWANYTVTSGDATADGTVTAAVTTTTGKSVAVTSGGSFTVDTKVAKPVITITSRCSADQDSLAATTDSDVNYLYVYRSIDTVSANLVAVAQVTAGQVDDVFIGDNVLGDLYIRALDTTGNWSDVITVANDITAAEKPALQLEAGDGVVTASWVEAKDASSYILRWREQGSTTWNERVVTGRKHDIAVANNKTYEVSVASQDAACNRSEFVTLSATPQKPSASDARGGIADHEAMVLAEALMVADTKDGEATVKSPFSLDEDRDQNGVRDAEEDKNGNGIPDGDEDTDENGAGDGNENEDRDGGIVQDRSRLIVTIAILLILAGTALAAYSWYQGEGPGTGSGKGGNGGAGDSGNGGAPTTETKAETAAAPAKKNGGAKPKRGGRRKARW